MVFCKKEYMKEYYKKNKERIKEYDKEWRKRNPNYAKEWRKNNPDYQKEYRKKNPDKYRGYALKYIKKYPEKIKAHSKLNNAVRDGRIVRPIRCSGCGEKLFPQGHHEDYSKGLEVDWLCVRCHNKLIKGVKK